VYSRSGGGRHRRGNGRRHGGALCTSGGAGSSGMQALVEGAQSKGTTALGLGAGTSGSRSVAETVVAAGGSNVSGAEGYADAHGDQEVEDVGRDGRDDGTHRAREELGDGEGLAGVAAERAWLGSV